MPLVAEIGYPLRLERTYDYEVPPSLEGAVAPGMRIRAPFGPRSAVGVVFSVRDASASPPLRRLKALEAVLDSEPAMTSELLDLCRWLARRYCCSLGECLRLLFPAHMLAKKRELKSAPLPEGLPQEPRPGQAAFQLTGSQSAALGRLEAALDSKTFSAHLIFGVPASGKTEVYLRLIRKAVQGEGQALFLVPEIALTQPFYEQFSADLGLPTALWHSQLGVRERREVWLGLRSGALRVVVGPRSASLLPFKRLRLAVMDEEQDESYKQDGQVPYYHARDVLLERARRAGALAVLGSATPSVESYSSVQAGLLVGLDEEVSADRDGLGLQLRLDEALEGLSKALLKAGPLEARLGFDDVLEGLEEVLVFVEQGLGDLEVEGAHLLLELSGQFFDELFGLLLLLEPVHLLAPQSFRHAAQAQVDVAVGHVDAQDLADDFLALLDVVADVADAARRDLRDVDHPGLVVLVELGEDGVVLDIRDRAEN